MTGVDLSVIVTCHDEGAIAAASIRSAEAAIARIEARGLVVERVLGLDAPTRRMLAWADQPALSGWNRRLVDCRDQGLSRNSYVRDASGRWIAFLDGDDLWGDAWLDRATCVMAQEPDARLVLHPEVVWQFGLARSVVLRQSQGAPLFPARYVASLNPYDSVCVAPRGVWLDHPFPPRRLSRGIAYEDWSWVIETMAAGWCHRVVPDTILFKRRRPGSQGAAAREARCLVAAHEALGIARLDALGKDCETGRTATGRSRCS